MNTRTLRQLHASARLNARAPKRLAQPKRADAPFASAQSAQDEIQDRRDRFVRGEFPRL